MERDLLMPTLECYEADFVVASGETSITHGYEFCCKALRCRRSAAMVLP